MKILHIANFQAPYKGNFIESLKEISDSSEEVQCVFCFPTVNANSPAEKWMIELRNDGNAVYNFSGKVWYDAILFHKIINRYKIDIIHAHFFSRQLLLSIRMAVLGTRADILLHCHNHSIESFGIKRYIKQLIHINCFMVACSKSVFKSIKRDFPKNKKYYVDNGIRFSRLETTNIIDRKSIGITAESKVLLIFGFDYYRKGVDIAVKTISKLNANEIKYFLLISLSKNRIIVEESISKAFGCVPEWIKIVNATNDVASLYNMCDLFLSPSREEGLPYSVLEAAYCNCGVVVSDIPPQKDLKIPYLVYHKSEDEIDLAKAIVIALEKHEEKQKNIEIVRTALKEHYSVEEWAKKIKDIYKEIRGE